MDCQRHYWSSPSWSVEYRSSSKHHRTYLEAPRLDSVKSVIYALHLSLRLYKSQLKVHTQKNSLCGEESGQQMNKGKSFKNKKLLPIQISRRYSSWRSWALEWRLSQALKGRTETDDEITFGGFQRMLIYTNTGGAIVDSILRSSVRDTLE